MVDGVATLIMDTTGNQNFVCYREVSPAQGFPDFSIRHGMHNQALEHNVAVFSGLSFVVRWQGRLVLRVSTLI